MAASSQSIQRAAPVTRGSLTREYLQGRRARWISAIRLYIIFSVVFFALGALAPARDVLADGGGGRQARGRGSPSEWATKTRASSETHVRPRCSRGCRARCSCSCRSSRGSWRSLYKRVDPNHLHHLYFALHVHAAWFALGVLAAAIAIVSSPPAVWWYRWDSCTHWSTWLSLFGPLTAALSLPLSRERRPSCRPTRSPSCWCCWRSLGRLCLGGNDGGSWRHLTRENVTLSLQSKIQQMR